MWAMVIFISIVFLQTHSEKTFDCKGYEEDSFHPMYDIDNCRFYWHCIYVETDYMRAIKRICPAGTEFDIRLNKCEISSRVNCASIQSSRIRTTTRPQELKVLPNNASQLTFLVFIEQFLRNLLQSSSTIEPEFDQTTHQISVSTAIPLFLTSKLRRRRLIHRHNLTLNILTSPEHKIRHFFLHRTHGILIHCNEIHRRQLRNLIFHTTTTTTTTTRHSSFKLFHSDILSLTICLIFTKLSN